MEYLFDKRVLILGQDDLICEKSTRLLCPYPWESYSRYVKRRLSYKDIQINGIEAIERAEIVVYASVYNNKLHYLIEKARGLHDQKLSFRLLEDLIEFCTKELNVTATPPKEKTGMDLFWEWMDTTGKVTRHFYCSIAPDTVIIKPDGVLQLGKHLAKKDVPKQLLIGHMMEFIKFKKTESNRFFIDSTSDSYTALEDLINHYITD